MERYLRIPIEKRKNAPKTTLVIRQLSTSGYISSDLPTVIILPGGPGANDTHYRSYDCLAKHYPLIYYNPRGCGLSDQGQAQHYTMDNYIDDLFYLVHKHLQLTQVVLIGKSYGAMCALGFAERYPVLVKKLVIAAGTTDYHFTELAKLNVLNRCNEDQIKICQKLWQGNFATEQQVSEFFKLMAPMYSFRVRSGDTQLTKSSLPINREVLNQGFAQQFWQFDFNSSLPRLEIPTLILIGEHDWITDPSYSYMMAKTIPNSELIVFNNADHLLEVDVSDDYFNSIKNFLDNNSN